MNKQAEVQKKESKSIFKFLLTEIIEFKGWEYIFKFLMGLFAMWGVYILHITYRFHTDPAYANVPKNSISDFKFGVVAGAIFFIYRSIVDLLLFKRIKASLDPVKFPTEEDKDERAMKFCKWVASSFYYICSTAAAFYLFIDQPFYPKLLGGEGECSAMFAHLPYVPDTPYAKEFYMVQFGAHLFTIVHHVVYKWKDSKFWEMFLHHGVALFLIFFSYLTNQILVGILVLVTHDPADIFLDLGRALNDSKRFGRFWNIALMYACFFFCWIYLRLFVFPKCLIGSAINKLNEADWGFMHSAYLYMILMMSALVTLHIYWFIFILKTMIVFLKKSKKNDFNIYDNKRKGN